MPDAPETYMIDANPAHTPPAVIENIYTGTGAVCRVPKARSGMVALCIRRPRQTGGEGHIVYVPDVALRITDPREVGIPPGRCAPTGPDAWVCARTTSTPPR